MRPEVCRALRAAVLQLVKFDAGTDLNELARRIGLPGCRLRADDDESALGIARLVELHNDICLEAAGDISRALRDRTLGHFFAKGIALLHTGVYGVRDRSLSDIDLYVNRQDCDAAVAALKELGYAVAPEPEQVGPPRLRSAIALEKTHRIPFARVQVDLHRALDPLDRLLPRNCPGIGTDFVAAAVTTGGLPVPALQHHCFILVHQLVHTDLLQIHTLIDLANIAPGLTEDGAKELWRLCADSRISGFYLGLIYLLESEFGVTWQWKPDLPRAIQRRDLVDWLRLVSQAAGNEWARITTARIRRRFGLLDGGLSRLAIFRDVFFPPADFLRWRWGGSATTGYVAHLAQVVRRLVTG